MLRADKLTIAPLPPLSFSVASGECLAIEGPSGSGKSRLLRAIADLEPASGQVFLEGAERNEMRAPQWRRRVRYVATESGWWTDTAGEVFPPVGAASSALNTLLSAIGLDAKMLSKPIASLSTGERQRLALARALVDQPRVLLLDEPTNGLDPHATALVEERIRRHLLTGCVVVLASHDAKQIDRLAHLRLQLAPAAGARAAQARALR